MGISFNDEVEALILLSSLCIAWQTVVTAISSSSEKLNLDDVCDLNLGESI